MEKKINVLMVTEGTYPFHKGGVSTWCDLLLKGQPQDVNFMLYSVIMNPFVTQKFNLPEDTQLIKVPLWGTEEPSEHLDIPFSSIYQLKEKTTDEVIERRFIPLFQQFVEEILSIEKNSERLGNVLFQMYQYFQEYEYKKSFKSELTWDFYKSYITEYAGNKVNKMQVPSSYSMIQSLGWLYRFMTVLNTKIPPVDVTHSVAAAFCGIPCVLAKFEYSAPFLLTEHGIYLREQYLSLGKREYPAFLSTFLIRLVHSVVRLNYYYADQVSPVCHYNTRWEKQFGVKPDKIRVIYNGVDGTVFSPSGLSPKKDILTVVSVARIDPVKDILSLLKAAAEVVRQVRRVKFIVYGSVTVEDYYEECLALKAELNLGDCFEFAGHTDDVASVYKTADVIALSSITEAFPYSVVEAMMSGKPVVSTNVGGVKEALGDCGIVVPPRNSEKLAEGILSLLGNRHLRDSLGADARERALNLFSIDLSRQQYYDSYLRLHMLRNAQTQTAPVQNVVYLREQQQMLLMDKAYALIELGLLTEAIAQLRSAIKIDPNSQLVPVILKKIADTYSHMGDPARAAVEIQRAKLLSNIV